MSSYPLLAVKGIDTTTSRFREQLVAGILSLGLNPSFIAAIISLESGFKPNIQNQKGAPALGLIQFWRDYFGPIAARAGMNVSWEDLRHLTAEEQVPLIVSYYQVSPLRKVPNATPTDYYMANLLPAFVGYPPSTVLGARDSQDMLTLENGKSTGIRLGRFYEQNSGLDANGDGVITISDVGRKIENIVSAAQGRARIPVPLPRTPVPRPHEASASAGSSPSASALAPYTFSPQPRAGDIELPVLRIGDRGPAVALLQQLLVLVSDDALNQPPLVDGEFGKRTELALSLHQRTQRLPADGVCGPRSWHSFIDSRTWSLESLTGARVLPEDEPS